MRNNNGDEISHDLQFSRNILRIEAKVIRRQAAFILIGAVWLISVQSVLPLHAAVGTHTSKSVEVTKEPEIVGVVPLSANPGEHIKLLFSLPISMLATRSYVQHPEKFFSVRFGSYEAPVVGVEETTLLVRVPDVSLEKVGNTDVPVVVFINGRRVKAEESFHFPPPPKAEYLEAKQLAAPEAPPLLVNENTQWLNNLLTIAAILILLGGSVGVVWYYSRQQRSQVEFKRKIEELRYELESTVERAARTKVVVDENQANISGDETAALAIEFPDIPPDLVRSCVQGKCVLFIGNGVSAATGRPTWREILKEILDSSAKESPGYWDDLKQMMQEGELSHVSQVIANRVEREKLIAKLKSFYSGVGKAYSEIWNNLASIQFANVVAGTWDPFVDVAFNSRNPRVLTPWLVSDLSVLLDSDAFCLVRLWGDLAQSKICFSTHEYQRAIAENPAWGRYVSTLIGSHPHLFVGAGLSAIETYLQSAQLGRPHALHYAFVPNEDRIAIHQERFLAQYNVKLIPFQSEAGWAQLSAIIEKLREQVQVEAQLMPTEAAAVQHAVVRRVVLDNIGPFVHQEVQLNPGWNALLGNNGSGKSTFLKALALGLCGDDPKAAEAASNLLRVGMSSGSIELQVGDENYRTDLIREGDQVRTSTKLVTPLQVGKWAVLGFPPLRGISRQPLSGPTQGEYFRPSVKDLLPLLNGTIDDRMSDIKQWLINIEMQLTPGSDISGLYAARMRQKRDAFFTALNKITPGTKLNYSHVDRSSWKVLVETDDGVVSIDQVSQGMSSTIGWLGALVERLYEIHHQSESPENEPALVLIDEVDAHLHPEWQQVLGDAAPKLFKNVQFIVTTHSPLVVSSLTGEQILHVSRDPKSHNVVMERPGYDVKGWPADQILMDPLFGLETARELETHRALGRYIELCGKVDLDKLEQDELADLARSLKSRIPTRADRSEAKEAFEMVQESFRNRFEQMDGEKRQRMVREIQSQIQDIVGGSE